MDAALARFRGGLLVHLDPADHELVSPLAELLTRYRGEQRLFLEIEGADGVRRRVRASERHGVRLSSELAAELEKLLGPGRARLAHV